LVHSSLLTPIGPTRVGIMVEALKNSVPLTLTISETNTLGAVRGTATGTQRSSRDSMSKTARRGRLTGRRPPVASLDFRFTSLRHIDRNMVQLQEGTSRGERTKPRRLVFGLPFTPFYWRTEKHDAGFSFFCRPYPVSVPPCFLVSLSRQPKTRRQGKRKT